MPGPATAIALRSYVEADAKAVRCETVRAIRGLVMAPEPKIRLLSRDPHRGVFRSAMGVLHDLELSLVAMSHSLAEGVEHSAGGKHTSP